MPTAYWKKKKPRLNNIGVIKVQHNRQWEEKRKCQFLKTGATGKAPKKISREFHLYGLWRLPSKKETQREPLNSVQSVDHVKGAHYANVISKTKPRNSFLKAEFPTALFSHGKCPVSKNPLLNNGFNSITNWLQLPRKLGSSQAAIHLPLDEISLPLLTLK